MNLPKSYQTFADFERDEIRPDFRVGFCVDDLVRDDMFLAELRFDAERDAPELEEHAGSLWRP